MKITRMTDTVVELSDPWRHSGANPQRSNLCLRRYTLPSSSGSCRTGCKAVNIHTQHLSRYVSTFVLGVLKPLQRTLHCHIEYITQLSIFPAYKHPLCPTRSTDTFATDKPAMHSPSAYPVPFLSVLSSTSGSGDSNTRSGVRPHSQSSERDSYRPPEASQDIWPTCPLSEGDFEPIHPTADPDDGEAENLVEEDQDHLVPELDPSTEESDGDDGGPLTPTTREELAISYNFSVADPDDGEPDDLVEEDQDHFVPELDPSTEESDGDDGGPLTPTTREELAISYNLSTADPDDGEPDDLVRIRITSLQN